MFWYGAMLTNLFKIFAINHLQPFCSVNMLILWTNYIVCRIEKLP